MKRFFDSFLALAGLVILAPVLAVLACTVWSEDRASPFYLGPRIGRGGKPFRMCKFRSMRPDAWKMGINSTASGDPRITRAGRLLRALKLDELPQLWNVLRGEMSFVGPRPQVPAEVSLYTPKERGMLDVRPGITDLASIAFADEAEILAGAGDPDLLYNQIIRPWKSRLALLYVQRQSLTLDISIVLLTLLALVSRRLALAGIAGLLTRWNADPLLLRVVRRERAPIAYPPPGAVEIVERDQPSYQATYQVTNA